MLLSCTPLPLQRQVWVVFFLAVQRVRTFNLERKLFDQFISLIFFYLISQGFYLTLWNVWTQGRGWKTHHDFDIKCYFYLTINRRMITFIFNSFSFDWRIQLNNHPRTEPECVHVIKSLLQIHLLIGLNPLAFHIFERLTDPVTRVKGDGGKHGLIFQTSREEVGR